MNSHILRSNARTPRQHIQSHSFSQQEISHRAPNGSHMLNRLKGLPLRKEPLHATFVICPPGLTVSSKTPQSQARHIYQIDVIYTHVQFNCRKTSSKNGTPARRPCQRQPKACVKKTIPPLVFFGVEYCCSLPRSFQVVLLHVAHHRQRTRHDRNWDSLLLAIDSLGD